MRYIGLRKGIKTAKKKMFKKLLLFLLLLLFLGSVAIISTHTKTKIAIGAGVKRLADEGGRASIGGGGSGRNLN